MADFRIQKFKIVDKTLYFTLLERELDGSMGADDKRRKAPWHKDLQAALDGLALHFAILTSGVDIDTVTPAHIKAPPAELTAGFHMHGYSFGGGDDKDEGISLMGHRIVLGGYSMTLTAPFRRFKEAPESRYKYMDDLERRLTRLDEEVRAYLDGTKRGTGGQGTLDMPDAPPVKQGAGKVTKAKIAPPESVTTTTAIGNKLPRADADAQARVREWSPAEYAKLLEEGKATDLDIVKAMPDDAADKKKTPTGKRGQQTAANPAGEPQTDKP